MCIICIKPRGVEIPESHIIRNMFSNNPDGAGLMYADKDRVRIEKGIMKVNDFLERIERFNKDTALVMHFRIGTGGGNTPGNTHPFPISKNIKDLKKLKFSADIGVCHNGVIDISTSRKDISDTMEYISARLVYIRNAIPQFYKDKNIMTLIDKSIDSKMCFLLPTGKFYTIGKFESKYGCLFSNSTYEYESPHFKYWGEPYSDYDSITPFEPVLNLMPLNSDLHIVYDSYTEFIDDGDGFLVDDSGNVFMDCGNDEACYMPNYDAGMRDIQDGVIPVTYDKDNTFIYTEIKF
ncbi:hypothetical protein LI142_08210 [Eubacterium limosum]|uniref:hypothetical protein n=1 Tax=Eubacterium limosum TaxID=1736 RepID=UPI001D07FE9A|nr:hypothetical protein [Eubacterium limosum]MCB6569482.1 hypothetical protein [Eubacterium limosum]